MVGDQKQSCSRPFYTRGHDIVISIVLYSPIRFSIRWVTRLMHSDNVLDTFIMQALPPAQNRCSLFGAPVLTSGCVLFYDRGHDIITDAHVGCADRTVCQDRQHLPPQGRDAVKSRICDPYLIWIWIHQILWIVHV